MIVLATIISLFWRKSDTTENQLKDVLGMASPPNTRDYQRLYRMGLHLPQLVDTLKKTGVQVDKPGADPSSVNSKKA